MIAETRRSRNELARKRDIATVPSMETQMPEVNPFADLSFMFCMSAVLDVPR